MRCLIFKAAALAVCIAVPALAEPVHYDVRARIAGDGVLDADVRVTLPADAAGTQKAFVLGRRFTLRSVDGGRGARYAMSSADSPVKDLQKLTFTYPAGKRVIRFRYSGPLNGGADETIPAIRPEGVELFIDAMWLPTGADIQTMFDVDAWIDGLPRDAVVVAQGQVTRTADGVRIHRRDLDVDLPMVAMAGLNRASTPGVEYYARDLSTPMSMLYREHAAAAAAYLQHWFGPLANPIRMVAVPRKSSMGYSRTAYTVVRDDGPERKDIPAVNAARHVSHEFAHAWWRSASPLTDDFWLVESTADYVAMRYVEQALGAEAVKPLIDSKREPAAKGGPVMGHGRPTRVQLYLTGPLLLIDLEKKIGREKMDALLLTVSKQTPNTTRQFLDALTEVAGADVARDFDAALHSNWSDAKP